MFKKILIANRGDVAVSIIRSCKELGIKTVAVYSAVDAESLHSNLADERYCIGPADPELSYCNIDAILSTAKYCGADAIFAGYGFLAESAEMARRCNEIGITFIGAKADVLDELSDTKKVKTKVREAGVPISEKKLVGRPKIIDIQLICDTNGKIIVVGDRDSSYRQGANRLIGESPAPEISEKTRRKLYRYAKKIAALYNYVGVGSAVFYVDQFGTCCFYCFVARLQVGCAITEIQNRINLTKWQIRISAGEDLGFTEDDIVHKGHTIGCRILAMHPETQMPSTGQISILHVPSGMGVRFDTAIYQNCKIPMEYEPMLAKLIVHAYSRNETIVKFRGALDELVTEGVHNNSEIYRELSYSEEFVKGEYDITSYDKFMRARKML